MMRALVFALAVAGCAPPTSSIDAFRRDPGSAERTIADCEIGRASGLRCENAAAGLAKARREARMEAFRQRFE